MARLGQEIINAQGWDDDTLLVLHEQYLENQGTDAEVAFLEFLKREAAEDGDRDARRLRESRRLVAQAEFELAEIGNLDDFEKSWNEDFNFWSIKIYRTVKPGATKVGSFGVEFAFESDVVVSTWQN